MPSHDADNSPDSSLQAELQSLFDALHRGEHTDAMRARLNELLASSDAAAAEFVKNVHERAALRMILGPVIEVGNQASAADGRRPAAPVGDGDSLAGDMPRVQLGWNSDAGGGQPPKRAWPITWSNWEGPFAPGQIVLGSFLGLALLAIGVWFGSAFIQDHRQAPPVAGRGEVPVVKVGPVNVDSGTVRMILPDVGDLVVEGPAKFALVSPMKLRLDQGRIKIRVTNERGHGFVVVTPHGEIVDLGTEFGVDATDAAASKLLVFEGQVDLRLPSAKADSVTRLHRGEGVRFDRDGKLDRIVSVSTGSVPTFLLPSRDGQGDAESSENVPVISDVYDNIRGKQTRTFYEIVRRGFRDKVLAYVDRTYEWHGAGGEGIPDFLGGADYVRTFNNDKLASLEVTMELGRRAEVFVFWDNRVPPTDWLKQDFADTGRRLELVERGRTDLESRGEPVPIRSCSIWQRRQPARGQVRLGSINPKDQFVSMYGIAAREVAEEPPPASKEPAAS